MTKIFNYFGLKREKRPDFTKSFILPVYFSGFITFSPKNERFCHFVSFVILSFYPLSVSLIWTPIRGKSQKQAAFCACRLIK
jgi:hypothetical protein